MAYSTQMLTTVIDCDTVLTIANKEKEDLDFRKLSLERQKDNATDNSVEIDTELAAVNAEITALNAVVAGLPDGVIKTDTQNKIVKLEYRKFLLTTRKTNYGSVSLVEKEYELACTELALTETNAFIAAVTARKAEL